MSSTTLSYTPRVRDKLKYISIKEARSIMGDDSKKMSDDEVQKAIIDLTTIVRFYIDAVPRC